MEPGTQIAYVPQHAEGDVYHPDTEYGFVVAAEGDDAHLCRFWFYGELGEPRSVSNQDLVEYASVPQEQVQRAIS